MENGHQYRDRVMVVQNLRLQPQIPRHATTCLPQLFLNLVQFAEIENDSRWPTLWDKKSCFMATSGMGSLPECRVSGNELRIAAIHGPSRLVPASAKTSHSTCRLGAAAKSQTRSIGLPRTGNQQTTDYQNGKSEMSVFAFVPLYSQRSKLPTSAKLRLSTCQTARR